MVVANNIPALNTSLSMRRADRGMQAAMRRLSSGFRINSAREDAAGLSIANKLTYQVGGLMRASENATHGTSLIQTAEGAMHEIHNMLQRMRELAVQAAHGTLSNSDKAQIQLEIDQLVEEIHGISRRTEFNRMRILNGEADRIIENRCDNVGLTRSVVTTTYVSANVIPGRIYYEITEVGRHAIVPLTLDRPAGSFPPPGQITVNEISMEVRAGMTWGDFDLELSRILVYAGVERLIDDAGNHFLVSRIAGSDQRVSLGGTAVLLDTLVDPADPRSDTGSNALITLDRMYDINNNPIEDFDAWAMSARGNQVTIRGNRGEEIRLNIQVQFCGNSPTLHGFADRDAVGNWVPAPTDDAAAGVLPREMTMDIRNFGPLMLQIGPGHNMAMSVQIPRINAETLGLAEFVGGRKVIMVNYRNTEGASSAIRTADMAINHVSSVRSRLGAFQNRLESTIRNLDVSAENTEISRSRIIDTDIARESTRFATYNVMMQAAQAILAQANQRPQMLVSLLQ